MIVVDGMDGQLLANAIPSMTREWNLPRAAFATASAAAPFGMMLGGVLGGMLERSYRPAHQRSSAASSPSPSLTLAAAFVNDDSDVDARRGS